jgi:F-type H+-transporting ATPase subunit epsilon
MPDALTLEVVTPDRAVLRESVVEVQIPGREGYLGILPGHTPLLTELTTGVLSYRQGQQTRRMALTGGFAEVLPDRVTVLANSAERAEEIDTAAARNELTAAEKQISGPEWEAALQSLALARTRLEAAAPGAAGHGSETH